MITAETNGLSHLVMSTISFLAVLHLELEFDKRSVFEMIQIYLNTEAPFGWSWEGEDPTS